MAGKSRKDPASTAATGAKPLSPSGAALLGLLAIDSWPSPWTTYELAKQSRRSLHWFWPRADRHLYDEPKKLVAQGYATAHKHATGRRPSTVYEITPTGREALAAWLDEEGKPAQHEIEQLIRVFFGEQGSLAQLRSTLARMEQQALTAQQELAEIVRDIADPHAGDRAAVNALSIKLVADLHRTVLSWSRWAQAEVAGWSGTDEAWSEVPDIFAGIVAEGETEAEAATVDRST